MSHEGAVGTDTPSSASFAKTAVNYCPGGYGRHPGSQSYSQELSGQRGQRLGDFEEGTG